MVLLFVASKVLSNFHLCLKFQSSENEGVTLALNDIVYWTANSAKLQFM